MVNESLQVQIHNLKVEKKGLQKKVAEFRKASVKLDPKRFKNPKISDAVKREIVHEALTPFYTQAQINWFLAKTKEGKHKRGYNWSPVDFTIALTIRKLSKATFNFIKKKRLIPLPSMETVRKHYKNFQIQEGHFPQVHSLLGLMALKMSGKELICCLSFDEVSNKADISYDSTHDQVVGPYSNMNVMMVRGMFGNYKVPIWAGFDTDITKEDILTAIKALHEAGFRVISVVCDMGAKNTNAGSARDNLGVTIEEPWF